jgi:hypothetical protein
MIGGVRSGALQFAQSARRLQAAARAAGLTVPAFRSPPRRRDLARAIRRLPGGAVIAVRVVDRSAEQVERDMIDGVLAANGLAGQAAERMRQLLTRALGRAGAVHGAGHAA